MGSQTYRNAGECCESSCNPVERRGLTQPGGLVPGLGVSLGKGSPLAGEHHQLDLKIRVSNSEQWALTLLLEGAECVPCPSSPALEGVSKSGKPPWSGSAGQQEAVFFLRSGFPSSLPPPQTRCVCYRRLSVCVFILHQL